MSWHDQRGASSCLTCRRRLPGEFRQRADGETPSQGRTPFAPVLPDDFCRYCSRALTAQAIALEETAARPRTRALLVAFDTHR